MTWTTRFKVSCIGLTEFLLPVLKVGLNTVFTVQAPAAFQLSKKHCNHLKTASQKLDGVTSQGLSVTLHCKCIKCNWILFSQTKRQWRIHCSASMGRQLCDECRWNFATLTLLISDRSAHLPLASHLKLSLMLSGGNYTLISWCHLELVVSIKWKWEDDWGLSITRQFSLSISQYTLPPLVCQHHFPHKGITSSQLTCHLPVSWTSVFLGSTQTLSISILHVFFYTNKQRLLVDTC